MKAQVKAVRLAAESDGRIPRLYVDGGFTRNRAFMQLLHEALPQTRIITPDMPDGTMLGAARYLDIFSTHYPQHVQV